MSCPSGINIAVFLARAMRSLFSNSGRVSGFSHRRFLESDMACRADGSSRAAFSLASKIGRCSGSLQRRFRASDFAFRDAGDLPCSAAIAAKVSLFSALYLSKWATVAALNVGSAKRAFAFLDRLALFSAPCWKNRPFSSVLMVL